jgi:hypothetical protein
MTREAMINHLALLGWYAYVSLGNVRITNDVNSLDIMVQRKVVYAVRTLRTADEHQGELYDMRCFGDEVIDQLPDWFATVGVDLVGDGHV